MKELMNRAIVEAEEILLKTCSPALHGVFLWLETSVFPNYDKGLD